MPTRTLVPLVVGLALAVGCYGPRRHDPHPSDHGVHQGHGPPPHAPAHGHRAKYHGHDLEYDGHRGVYTVLGLAGIFWYDGWYHRRTGDRWQRSDRFDGPWRDSPWDHIPPGLRGGGHGHGKGHWKDKGKKPY